MIQTVRRYPNFIISCCMWAMSCSSTDSGGSDPTATTDVPASDVSASDELGTSADVAADVSSQPEDTESDAGPDVSDLALVPMLGEALECSPKPGTGVTPGNDLRKVTLASPDAICNDGTPAVMYVRSATGPENAGRWVFHLQGGGSCSGAGCAGRWCDRNEKMTTAATPGGMVGKGIMRRSDENTFGDANQVFLYYCSSDNWAGTMNDAVIPENEQNPSFRLHFRGKAIVDAALDALEAGVTSDDGTETLPKLAGGGVVLWTGTSGGCQGVANTADRVAARLIGVGKSPYIVCDANFGPVAEDLPSGAALDALLADRELRYELSTAYGNPLRDESCVAMSTDDPWLCEWSGHVLANHITGAPLFVRMSLADGTISDGYLSAGFSIQDFAMGVRSALVRAASAGGLESTMRPIAAYGPGCTQHVGLTNDDWFFVATVEAGGEALTFHDALVRWVDGEDVIAIDTVPPSVSVCAQTTDDTD